MHFEKTYYFDMSVAKKNGLNNKYRMIVIEWYERK